jgi:hypothetical protein
MVAIAGAIIRQRTGHFDPGTYRDRYQEALQQLIEAKTKGLTITPRAVSTPGRPMVIRYRGLEGTMTPAEAPIAAMEEKLGMPADPFPKGTRVQALRA